MDEMVKYDVIGVSNIDLDNLMQKGSKEILITRATTPNRREFLDQRRS
jgi:hypothetical protein